MEASFTNLHVLILSGGLAIGFVFAGIGFLIWAISNIK